MPKGSFRTGATYINGLQFPSDVEPEVFFEDDMGEREPKKGRAFARKGAQPGEWRFYFPLSRMYPHSF